MTGDKSRFAGSGGLIGASVGLAAIVWVLDSSLDSIIFQEGTLIGQLLYPTAHEIGIRVLFGSVLIVFGIYTQMNTGRRTHLEGTLRQSEEKYRMLVENIQEGVFIIQDAKFQFVNETFARTAGYNVGEVIGRNFKDFVAPEDLKMVADRYYRRQAGESVPSEYEFHMVRNDGTKIAVNMNVGLVTYRGRVASMGILKDITERKLAQEAMRKSEEKFRDIFEKSPIAIELYDKTGKLIDANRSCLDLFGVHNIESVIGFKLFDDPNITEDTKTRLSNGESTEFESVFDLEIVKKARLYETTKSGKCYLDILIVPLTTEERENYGYLVHVRDITERKQAEEALSESEKAMKGAVVKADEEKNKSNAIIAALGDGIIIQDTDYKIVYQNQVQNDLFGNHIGEYCYKVYEGRDSICEWCPVEKTFRDGKIHRTEREINTGNGLSYYELVSSPLRDSAGKIIAGVKVVRNITELKRTEGELRERERFLADIFASIQDGIGIIDKDMNILRVNKTAEKWYPHTKSFIGRKCFEAYHGRNERCEVCPAWETLKTGESAYATVSKHGPDGKKIGWLEIYSFPLTDTAGGEMKGVIEYVRDITERKRTEEALAESENKFRTLFDNAIDGILLADIETKKFYLANKKMCQMLGYSFEEIKTLAVEDIHPEKELAWILEVFEKQVTGACTLAPDIPVKRKDDTVFYADINTSLVNIAGKAYSIGIFRDITERKQTEEALRKSMSMLKKAQEIGQMGSWEWDITTNEVTWSDEIYKLYGLNPEKDRPNYDTIVKTLTPESRDWFINAIERALKHGKVFDGEYGLFRPDGERRYTHTRGEVIQDKDGNPVRMIGIVQDITERKQVETEKDKLLKAIENSTDGITIADEKDRYIYVNAAYAKTFGYAREEFVGKTWRKITPHLLIPPTEKGLSCTMHNRDVGVFNGEVPGLRKDGTEIPTEVRGTALWDENGNYAGHICIVRDITERKKVEEKLKLLSEAVGEAPDGVQVVDLNGFIIYSNRAVEDIYGFSSDELKGKHVNEMNADPEFAVKEILPNLKTKGKWTGELIAKKKNGQEFPIWLTTSMVKNSNEEPIAMVGVIRDITERKHAEEEIKKYTRELEESNRMKELFADIMHHDLLNPLNTANGFIEILKENETVSQKKAYLETIERSLVKGMELIDSAMKYSKFESLESIELEKLDLNKTIEEVIEALTPIADDAGMEIVNRVPLKTPMRANKIIEEVFSNLISNAIKYASSGKRIIIESENKGENLQVRVIDFGEGIKERDKNMIFERFRRGGKTGVKGSGLGLAIAGKIMELHNGRIWVEDNPEGGSIFIVELPGNR